MNQPLDYEAGPPDRAQWWRARRRFAIGAALFLIFVILYALFKVIPEHNVPLIIAGSYTAGAIIISYIGGAVVDDWLQKPKR